MDTGKAIKTYVVLSFITLLRSLYMPHLCRKWLRITVQETREPFRTLEKEKLFSMQLAKTNAVRQDRTKWHRGGIVKWVFLRTL